MTIWGSLRGHHTGSGRKSESMHEQTGGSPLRHGEEYDRVKGTFVPDQYYAGRCFSFRALIQWVSSGGPCGWQNLHVPTSRYAAVLGRPADIFAYHRPATWGKGGMIRCQVPNRHPCWYQGCIPWTPLGCVSAIPPPPSFTCGISWMSFCGSLHGYHGLEENERGE